MGSGGHKSCPSGVLPARGLHGGAASDLWAPSHLLCGRGGLSAQVEGGGLGITNFLLARARGTALLLKNAF